MNYLFQSPGAETMVVHAAKSNWHAVNSVDKNGTAMWHNNVETDDSNIDYQQSAISYAEIGNEETIDMTD